MIGPVDHEAREVDEKAGAICDAERGERNNGDRFEKVAGKTRVMEDHLINAAGSDVTPAFRHSLRPLLGADVIEVARLRAAKVEKAGVLSGM